MYLKFQDLLHVLCCITLAKIQQQILFDSLLAV